MIDRLNAERLHEKETKLRDCFLFLISDKQRVANRREEARLRAISRCRTKCDENDEPGCRRGDPRRGI